MLETVIYNQGEYTFPSLLVLGCFDALHIGHRELLKKAKLQAKINGLDLGVMLFKDGKGGDMVLSLDERIKILESYNVKFILLAEFNDEFKKTTPAQFLEVLDRQLNLKGIMSGKDFHFGAGAKGKSSTLKHYADDEENGVWYTPVKEVMSDGVKVSTTGIKELLTEGNVAKAAELLGGCYSVSGEVVHGAGRGGEVIGFPTVNVVYPENKIKIKQGVYKVKSTICGTEYYGIANYGARPTFGEQDCVLEVNYDGFSGDIYGEIVTVEFVDYIRDIETFEDAEQLAEQLEKDKLTIEGTEEQPALEPTVAAAEIAKEVVEETDEQVSEEITETIDGEITEVIPEETEEEVTEEIPEETEEEVTEEIPEENEEQVTEEIPEETEEEVTEVIPEETEEQVTEEIPEETEEQVTEEIPEETEEEVTEVIPEETEEEEVTEEIPEKTEEVVTEVIPEENEDQVTEEIPEETEEEVAEEIPEETEEVVTKEIPEENEEQVTEEIHEETEVEVIEEISEETEVEVTEEISEETEEVVAEVIPEETEVEVIEEISEETEEEVTEEIPEETEEEVEEIVEDTEENGEQ